MSAISIDISPTANYIQIPPFLPSDVSGLEIWLDASDISTLWQDTGKSVAVTTDGQTVGAIADQSGNGNDFLADTAAKEPTYKENIFNSLSVLRFDGSSDWMESSAIAALNTSTITWFLVLKTDDIDTTQVAIRSNYSSNSALWGSLVISRLLYEQTRATGGGAINVSAPIAENLTITSGVWAADDSLASYRYGSFGGSTAGGTMSPSGHIKTILGGDTASEGTALWDGDIGELVVYSAELSDEDRRGVEQYLTSKWGVMHMETTSIVSKYSGSSPDDHLSRPDMVDNDGTWIHVYREAAGHGHDTGAELHIRFSTDDGENWTAEDTFTDSSAVTGFPITEHSTNSATDCTVGKANNGDLFLLVGEIDSSDNVMGTWLYTSSDDGDTWSDDGQINTDADLYLSSGDYVVISGDIYAVGWKDPSTDGAPFKSSLYKSINNGAAWSLVSDITSTSDNTAESGVAHLGGNDLITIMQGGNGTSTYKRTSDDLGATWGSLTDIKDNLTYMSRPKFREFAEYPGKLFLVARSRTTSAGTHYASIFYTEDDGVTWFGPYFPDSAGYTDGGYNDILPTATGFYMFSYGGTTTDSDIYEYKITTTTI
jgi:hypothetical protein